MQNLDAIKVCARSTAGIDLGDRYCEFVILNAEGESSSSGRFRTTVEGLRAQFVGFEPMQIAIEIGTHVHWVKDALEGLGHEVIVANARQVRLIYRNDRKSDRMDAEFLARLARMDPKLLAPVKLRTGECQNDLMVIRARENLVRVRTQLINATRGLVKSRGVRLKACSTRSFHRKVIEDLPQELMPAVAGLLEMIGVVSQKIADYDRKVETLSQDKYPVTGLLRQVKGVGPVTALTYVLTLGDPRRFRKSREVGAYLGLVPRRRQSGDRDPELRISKAGNEALRSLLVQSAHYILGPFGEDCDLRRFGEKIKQRGGKRAKRQAVVAVARKLAVLLHRLWITAEVYEPLRNADPKVKSA